MVGGPRPRFGGVFLERAPFASSGPPPMEYLGLVPLRTSGTCPAWLEPHALWRSAPTGAGPSLDYTTMRQPTLERLPSVKARTGLSRSEIYRRSATGDFPQPVKLGAKASAWSSAEIDNWIAARLAERDAKAVAA